MRNFLILVAVGFLAVSCAHRKGCCGDKAKAGKEMCKEGSKCSHKGMADAGASGPQEAQAELKPLAKSKVSGTTKFSTLGSDVVVAVQLKGLKAKKKHGFHIHEVGNCSAADGSSAGGHFNPGSHAHGAPDSHDHHAGDMGNLEADAKGMAQGEMKISGVTLAQIVGRSVVVHASEDNFTAQPSGDAGDRIACGVIGVTR